MALTNRDANQCGLVVRPSIRPFSRLHVAFTWSIFWRLLMSLLMTCTFVFGMWIGIVSPAYATAYAASIAGQPLAHSHSQTPQSKQPRHGAHHPSSTISACPTLSGTPNINGNFNGLGTAGYYTLIKASIDDRLVADTNVANGNFVVQDTAVDIKGTGIDLLVQTTYNSQSSASGTLGANWNLSVGNGVSLSFDDGNATLHGSSGFAATFFADNNSYQGYDEPAGLDATLLNVSNNPINGASYVVIFQKTSECFGFNSSGAEIFDQDHNGHQITFAYTGQNLLSSITDTQNRVTSFGYDFSNRVNLITDPIGRTVQFAYQDGNNNLTSFIDMDGNTTSFGYSGHDLTSISSPNDTATGNIAISYLTGDKVGTYTDATKAATSYDYDQQGESDCSFDAQYPCTEVTDANSNTTTYATSGLEVVKVQDASGNIVSNTYTPDANISQYTDQLGNNTIFGFDSGTGHTNNLLSVTDGNGAKTAFSYTDSSDPYLPTNQQNPQNATTAYGYDNVGNLQTVTDTTKNGTGTSVSYSYNKDVPFGSYLYGTLSKTTDGDNHPTTYTYDSFGNLHIITPPAPLKPETIGVDNVSRVTSVIDGKGQQTTFKYDNLDRIKKITYNNGETIAYQYDNNGNVLSVTDNTGTTSFSYDNDNRILTKSLPGGEVLTTSYDPVGNLQTYTDSGGTIT